jgi:Peptidase propeptide and YPEB domain
MMKARASSTLGRFSSSFHREALYGCLDSSTEEVQEMSVNRKTVAIAAAVAAVAAGGVGIAYAVGGGESEEQVTGPEAKKAIAAALDQVGGGEVLEAEYQEAEGTGVYEVEIQRPDGSQVEVHVSGDYQALGTAADDDTGSEDEGAEDEGAGDDD